MRGTVAGDLRPTVRPLEVFRVLLGMTAQTAGRDLNRYLVDYDEHYYLDGDRRVGIVRRACPDR
jgi:hypothetical protein